MADELIDICDENNRPIGVKKMKSEAHKNGLWHKTAHIWIYNSNGEILLQLRAKNKDLYPNVWDISAAGHVSAGETPIVSALRETKEEIGLSAKPQDLEFFKIRKSKSIYKEIKNNEFCYVYLLKFDGDINSLVLQEEEVTEIQFLSTKKILEELKIEPNKYVPHGNYWLDIIDRVERVLN